MTYLDAQCLKQFEQLLTQQLQTCQAELDAIHQQLIVQNTAPDPIDRASAEEERGRAIVQRDRLIRLQQETHDALGRIRSGEYGYCEDSGEEIGLKRLLARPTSRYTVEAQERLESRAKQFAS